MTQMVSTKRLNQRQRAFARGIAEGLTHAEAQCSAGYLPNRKNKNQLLRDKRVLAEIDRLRALVDAEWARRQCDKGAPDRGDAEDAAAPTDEVARWDESP